ncbi:MAG: MFS transporter [Planctomycetaceae bacterium]
MTNGAGGSIPVAPVNRAFWTLLVALFVNKMGTMVVPFLAFYLKSRRGMSESEAAALVGLLGMGGLIGAPLGGWCADRFGRKPTILCGLLGASLSMGAMPFCPTARGLAVLVVSMAVCADLLRPAAAAAVADLAPPALRARAFGVFRAAMNLGFGAGALLGGLLASRSYPALFLIDAATGLLAFALVLLFVVETRPERARVPATLTSPPPPLRAPVGRFALLCGLSFLVFTVSVQFMSNFPLSLERRGVTEKAFGFLIVLNTAWVVVAQIPVSLAAGRARISDALALGAACYGLGYCLAAFSVAPFVLAACVTIFTLGEMLFFPMAATYVAQIAPVASRGRWMGLFNMTHGFAFLLAPSAGALLLTRAGDRALWLAAPLIGMLAALGFLLQGRLAARLDRA